MRLRVSGHFADAVSCKETQVERCDAVCTQKKMSGQLTGNVKEDKEASSQDSANVIAAPLAASSHESAGPRQKRVRTQPASLLSETSLPTEWTSLVYGQYVGSQRNLMSTAHALNCDNSVAVPWSAPSVSIGAPSVNVGSTGQATEYVPTQYQPMLSSLVTSVGVSGIRNVGNGGIENWRNTGYFPSIGYVHNCWKSWIERFYEQFCCKYCVIPKKNTIIN